jgi:hypothetical protein
MRLFPALLFICVLSYGAWVTSYSPVIVPPRVADNKIRFIWTSDSHFFESNADTLELAYREIIDTCRTRLPDFFITTGDLTSSGPQAIYHTFLGFHNALRPVFFTVGNHDECQDTALTDQYYPDTDHSRYVNWIGYDAPYYKTWSVSSGDSTFKLRVIALDMNFYDTGGVVMPRKERGTRIGLMVIGGQSPYRSFFQPQIDWVDSVLAADTTSDAILLSTHYTATRFVNILDVVADDGRPMIFIRGHNHGPLPPDTLYNTAHTKYFVGYKVPAFMGYGADYGGFAWMTIRLNAGTIIVDSAVMLNYVKPGIWDTLYNPFTLPNGAHY